MAEFQLIKMPGGTLRPANQDDADRLQRIENGRLVLADIKQPRNPLFHRKLFALLNFAFDYWTPEPMDFDEMTIEPEKSFDRFRKDVLILSGFRYAVVNIKNQVRYEAESISFAEMDETRFHEVYRAVFSTLWRMILSKVQGMTQQDVDNAINQLLSFD